MANICAGTLHEAQRTNYYSTGAGGNECAFSGVGTVLTRWVCVLNTLSHFLTSISCLFVF